MLAGMGTELQFSQNLFSSLPRSHGGAMTVTFETPENRSSPRNIHQMESSRPSQPLNGLGCVKDSFKKTILEHEKIFRNQVQELHRVYRTQKLLMSRQVQDGLGGIPTSEISGNWASCSDEDCDLELTLSIGGGSKKKSRSGSRSESKFGCCPESSANSTGHGAAFTPAGSDPGAENGPICRC